MSKLTKFLGEYFLGNDTRQFYKNHRNMITEYESDLSVKSKLIEEVNANEIAFLAFRRVIPNILDVIGFGATLLTNDKSYLWICSAGELIRLSNYDDGRFKGASNSLRYTYQIEERFSEMHEGVNNLIKKADNLDKRIDEGEDWKKIKS